MAYVHVRDVAQNLTNESSANRQSPLTAAGVIPWLFPDEYLNEA